MITILYSLMKQRNLAISPTPPQTAKLEFLKEVGLFLKRFIKEGFC